MKWILIVFVFIFGCITDEASHCERLKNERRGDGGYCENLLSGAEAIFRSAERRGEINSREDPNSTGNIFLKYAILVCIIDYKEAQDCKKKSHIIPTFGKTKIEPIENGVEK